MSCAADIATLGTAKIALMFGGSALTANNTIGSRQDSTVQSDTGYGTINPETDPKTQKAAIGEALLGMGIIPEQKYLDAMGIDEPTARGIQSVIWLSMEDDPEAQQAMETLIDLAAGDGPFSKWDGVAKPVITDGSHIDNGQLKPNVLYCTGEHAYFYETNADGLVVRAFAEDLKFKTHDGRLEHNPNTYGKQPGDHAGHLFGDRFGGSPELDNLVSQAQRVNLSEYKIIENQWANALKNGQKVSVSIDVKYEAGSPRPVTFEVHYEIDGEVFHEVINN